MSLTQLSNHNGESNLGIRLIYVMDRHNGMPVRFRYCPGGIADVSTLCVALAELSQYGISIDYAIADSGYFSENNIKELYKNNIHFVTRLAPKRLIYKQIVKTELPGLLSSKYTVRYGDRLVYLKKKQVDIYEHNGYACIGTDMDSRNQQYKRTAFAGINDKNS
jgi:transposase